MVGMQVFILGVDVSRTFTDLAAHGAGTHGIRTTKVLSLKENPAPARAHGPFEVGLGRVIRRATAGHNLWFQCDTKEICRDGRLGKPER
jgi:hypothetical protein